MSSTPPPAPADESALAQEKFDFYMVALNFTVLGLAIQTGKFGTNSVCDCAELIGWFYLTIAGFIGIQRLKRHPITLGLLRFSRVVQTLNWQAIVADREKIDKQIEEVRFDLEHGIGYDTDYEQKEAEQALRDLEAKHAAAKTQIREEVLAKLSDQLNVAGAELKRSQRIQGRANIQLAAFCAGILMLLFARALPPIADLLALPAFFSTRILH